MWYIINTKEYPYSRSFNELSLLLKTIMENDEKGVINYINEQIDLDAVLIDKIEIPFLNNEVSLGELTVSWAKFSGKWDELIQLIVKQLEQEILDYFEDIPLGCAEVVYLGDYAITHN